MPTDDAPHILVIDDDKRLLDLLSQFLIENGFRVSTASTASLARDKLRSLSFDLLIVDVMMPDESGTDFTIDLRRRISVDVPVLMLTALGEIEARVKGLESGADDYLAKPFDPRELLLRLHAILKRSKRPDPPLSDYVSFGPYMFSLVSRELHCDDVIVRLTQRERDILYLFAERHGGVVSRDELVCHSSGANERTVDVQINRLRRKIESDGSHPRWLQTVRGIGYRLCID